MNCPKCGFEIMKSGLECPKCGLILSKFKKSGAIPSRPSMPIPEEKKGAVPGNDQENLLAEILFYVKPKVDSVDFGLRLLCAIVFFIWSLCFIFSSINNSGFGFGFWHMVNLPFHESGHIIFRPFWPVLTSLGGTLAQLLMPLICLGVFLLKTRDTFAAGFCLWWLGENFIDIAPYIDDARRLTMPLVGGNTGMTSPYGFHDWEFILTETGLLKYDHFIAQLSHMFGLMLMILTFIWWGIVLHKYYKNL